MRKVTTNLSDSKNRQSMKAVYSKLSVTSNNFAKLSFYDCDLSEYSDDVHIESEYSQDLYSRCNNSINLVSDVQISDKVSNKKHIAEFYVKSKNKLDIYCNNIMYYVIYDYLKELSETKSVTIEKSEYTEKVKKASDLKSYFKNIVLTESDIVSLIDYCFDYFRQYVELDLNIQTTETTVVEKSEKKATSQTKKTSVSKKSDNKKKEA